MTFCLFLSGMLVLLTKTLTSHVYCKSLTFPSEKSGMVLLGIRVHWPASLLQSSGDFIPRNFY